MNLDELRRDLALIAQALERRVEIWRPVTTPDGRVIKRIYRGFFQKPRTPEGEEQT